MGLNDILTLMRFLTLTNDHCLKMIAHVESHLPFEACGLLAGHDSKVETVLEVKNQAQSRVRFVMDPIDQLKAFDWIDTNNMELVGIFHSHPSGPETVSPTDIAEAAYAVVNIILAQVNDIWSVRGFWIENKAYDEVTLHVL